MKSHQRRRDFLIGGAAGLMLRPGRVGAQPAKVPQVGVLTLGNADADSFGVELRQGLRESGYVEGRNIRYEFRSAAGNMSQLPALAAELVALKADVLVALFTPCVLAAKQATREIPIVTVSGDPVNLGLVANLAQPGGNITGISLVAAEMHGKCVELFRDGLGARKVGFLGITTDPFWRPVIEQIRLAGRTAGVEIAPEIVMQSPDETDAALARMKQEGVDAVVVQATVPARHVVDSALRHKLPAATMSRAFAEIGGMMSYGADGPEVYRRGTLFVAKILQGANPATMPIEQPTKFELVLNLKTAKVIGAQVSDSFVLRADTIIE